MRLPTQQSVCGQAENKNKIPTPPRHAKQVVESARTHVANLADVARGKDEDARIVGGVLTVAGVHVALEVHVGTNLQHRSQRREMNGSSDKARGMTKPVPRWLFSLPVTDNAITAPVSILHWFASSAITYLLPDRHLALVSDAKEPDVGRRVGAGASANHHPAADIVTTGARPCGDAMNVGQK